MSVFRVEKNKNYTVMSNHHLKNKKLSFKAKGLLSYMLSLPDDWDYSIEGLCKAGKDNKSAIKTALNELKENGYLKIDKLMPNNSSTGRIEYVYTIFESPKTRADFLYLENQSLENQSTEKHTQLNTKKQNTKKRKDKKKKFDYEFTKNDNIDFSKVYDN